MEILVVYSIELESHTNDYLDFYSTLSSETKSNKSFVITLSNRKQYYGKPKKHLRCKFPHNLQMS